MNKCILGVLAVLIFLALSATVIVFLLNLPLMAEPQEYSCVIVNTYPHDRNAFTQGLLIDDAALYESTGLYGNSSLRCVELETGEVLQVYALPPQYFGEGIAAFEGKLVQLTWKSQKGFVYDEGSFKLLQEFNYSTEGWGITYDGSHLIMSDGTSTLYFLDPETFQKTGQVEVHDAAGSVDDLNELECVKGDIYANIWMEEKIAIINPRTGQVKGWINMTGLQNMENQDVNNVLNGIAYDAKADRLFVTGKRWSQLFEITLVPEQSRAPPSYISWSFISATTR
jgi:glutamine cyclotransferase